MVSGVFYCLSFTERPHACVLTGQSAVSGRTGIGNLVDSAINALGRAAFFPQFAVFPVDYLDADIAVFTFPPLNSRIAVQRVR